MPCGVPNIFANTGRQRLLPSPKRANVPTAAGLMRADHYGWFERVERGVYQLTPQGSEGLAEYAATVRELKSAKDG